MRPRIILHDPEGAAARNHNTGTGVVGDPGSGKSAATKKSGVEKVKRGAQIVAFDPGPLEEWRKAFRHVPGAVAYNPTKDRVCVDPLRCFPYEEAGDVAADHLLPMIGVPNHSRMQAEFTLAVRPDHRTGNGIHSSRGLIEYLRRQPNPDENELLIRLEAAAASSYTRAVFDDSREPYRPGGNPATIWLTNGLGLPDEEDIADPEKYRRLQLRQLAGMAIYGLLIDLEQRYMFANPQQYSEMIFEEAKEMLAYPAGARTAHKITLQGRKHATGGTFIVQDYRHIENMGDKFLTQKWLFRIWVCCTIR
ncbi:ATP-binding protein [Mycolicibacterium aubagnense]|uniref:ATP-binding protein n=1 Tax=Mycolicibacterium aubagnense TaxID=319707 RepID=UPI001F3A0F34|nr:ATP-binding protein [Mycolicibacterium aubagnense]